MEQLPGRLRSPQRLHGSQFTYRQGALAPETALGQGSEVARVPPGALGIWANRAGHTLIEMRAGRTGLSQDPV